MDEKLLYHKTLNSKSLQIKGVSEQPEAVAEKITEARHLKRRETIYSKDDLVLVYKPFKKVGKSDKQLQLQGLIK